jgi:hypothetical protein
MEKKYQLRCANVFHAGDGNLHPLILFDANDPDQLHRCELFGADILETSVAMGGTVTGEHGVGWKSSTACACSSAPKRTRRCSGSSAPLTRQGLLNPGKVIPTLNRCAEYGKMLVRGGQIKHPELSSAPARWATVRSTLVPLFQPEQADAEGLEVGPSSHCSGTPAAVCRPSARNFLLVLDPFGSVV